MPFIKKNRRDIIDKESLLGLFDIQVGDKCYREYKTMVARWKENPCWTTAHKIYQDVIKKYSDFVITGQGTSGYLKNSNTAFEDRAAHELAWQVFFQKYVMPYEDKKEQENGTI